MLQAGPASVRSADKPTSEVFTLLAEYPGQTVCASTALIVSACLIFEKFQSGARCTSGSSMFGISVAPWVAASGMVNFGRKLVVAEAAGVGVEV